MIDYSLAPYSSMLVFTNSADKYLSLQLLHASVHQQVTNFLSAVWC